jgi:hypothetical protein
MGDLADPRQGDQRAVLDVCSAIPLFRKGQDRIARVLTLNLQLSGCSPECVRSSRGSTLSRLDCQQAFVTASPTKTGRSRAKGPTHSRFDMVRI